MNDEINDIEITMTIGQLREQMQVIAEERDKAIDEANHCRSHSILMQDRLVAAMRRHEVALNEVHRLEAKCRDLERLLDQTRRERDEKSQVGDDINGELIDAADLRRRVAELEARCRELKEDCDYMAQELHECMSNGASESDR